MVKFTKSNFVNYGLPAVGAFFLFLPHEIQMKVPIVAQFAHQQHQAFGAGILVAWAVSAYFLLVKKNG